MKRLCLFFALAGTVAAAQAAEAYRWVDANGVVHYSDVTPPAETKAELVHLRGTGSSTTGAAVSIPEEPAKADDSKEPGEKKPPGTLANSVQSAEKRCADARANLEVLQRNGPVGMDTGAAKPQPLDDATRQRQIGSAQAIIATYCK
ncbi:MAG TPA: DUF4124 domain-containing protein [Rudaea sp.]|nr:DUF4124 domain-containing protein [Rudaea sp.]